MRVGIAGGNGVAAATAGFGGNQSDLRASLDRSPAVAIYKQWVGAVGVGYDVQSRREQTFPAYAGSINLERARTTR